jgi:hypothetical protein
MRQPVCPALALAALLLGIATVPAQETPAPAPPVRYENWSVAFTIPIWIPGVSGTLASGGHNLDFDRPENPATSKGSTVSDLEFAFLGRADTRLDRWIAYSDLFTLTVDRSTDFVVDGVEGRGSATATVARLLGGYRVVEGDHQAGSTSLDVDLLAGLRYYYLHTVVTQPPALAFDVTKDWFDPLIGTRFALDFGGPIDVWLLADIGGFGAGSKLSWSATIAGTWHLSRHFALELGYTALSIDYSIHGGNRFEYQLDLQGPELAITYVF